MRWDDAWFDHDSTGYVHYDGSYDEDLHELATTLAVLSGSAYDEGLVKEALTKLGFDSITSYYPDVKKGDYDDPSRGGYNQVGYAFGIRQRADGVPIIAVIVRGTPSNCEWLSNFNISDTTLGETTVHEGFSFAQQEVHTALNQYAERHAGSIDLSKARVVITGHSRGAAVANLLGMALTSSGQYLSKQLSKERIYCFTFATPAVVVSPRSGFENIYNIVNPEDVVPKVPLSQWGYGRYGTTLVLPSRSNTSRDTYTKLYNNMNELFRTYSGTGYVPFAYSSIPSKVLGELIYDLSGSVDDFYNKRYPTYVGGIRVPLFTTHDFVSAIAGAFWGTEELGKYLDRVNALVQFSTVSEFQVTVARLITLGIVTEGLDTTKCLKHGHTQETYVSWMQSGSPEEIFRTQYQGITVECPVDVKVYDSGGRLVASIVDDVVDERVSADGLAAAVLDGVKMVDIPSDEKYRVELIARDEGEMDYSIETLDGISDEPLEVRSYRGVSLVKGSTFTSFVGEGSPTLEVTLLDQNSAEVDPESKLSTSSPTYVSLTVEVEGSGNAWGDANVLVGSKATVHAEPADGWAFDGWYSGNELVGEAEELTLRVGEDTTLVARFSALAEDPDVPGGSQGGGQGGTGGDPSGAGRADINVEPCEHGGVTVSPNPAAAGDDVVVTTDPDAGFEVRSVEVVDSGGKAVSVADNGNGTWTFEMPSGEVTVRVAFGCDGGVLCVGRRYSDVDVSAWYHDAVDFVVASELMTGYGNGSDEFGPGDPLAREQAATVLWRAMEGDDESSPCGLLDVDESAWYAPSVNWACKSGLMTGYADGSNRFGVGDALTREQFAVILWRAVGEPEAEQSSLDGFSDGGESSEWALPALSWAVQAGVLGGSDDGDGGLELRPGADINRAEMAAMLMRSSGLI